MPDGLLARLRGWIRSLLGRGSGTEAAAGTAADAAAAPEAEAVFKCDVCGTPVEAPDEPCPLCHSETIVPVDAVGDGDHDATTPTETGPTPVERRVSDGDSGDAAASLADLRDSDKDVLARHADKWEDRESSGSRRYRVTLPDGGERFVGSREDVRSLLFRYYGAGESTPAPRDGD